MKKLLIAGAALAALIGTPALAADLALKAPPAPAPAWSWTGFYIGGNAGYLVERDSSGLTNFTQPGTPTSNPGTNTAGMNSFTGGGQIGFNWQFAPRWVAGVEGDWNWTDPKSNFCRSTDADGGVGSIGGECFDADRGFLNFSQKTDWLATARGRLGWLVSDNVLFYGTAGGAWGKVETTLTASCAVDGCGNSAATNVTSATFSSTRSGWVAGAGVQAMLTSNWIARIEWLHYDLGNLANAFTSSPALGSYGVSYSRNLQYDAIRFGLDYKFSWMQ